MCITTSIGPAVYFYRLTYRDTDGGVINTIEEVFSSSSVLKQVGVWRGESLS